MIKKFTKNNYYFLLLLFVFPFLSILLIETAFRAMFTNKISPGVYFAGKSISGLTEDGFYKVLSNKNNAFKNINIHIENEIYNIDLENIDYRVNYKKSWDDAYLANKKYLEKPFFPSILVPSHMIEIVPAIDLNTDLLVSEIDNIRSIHTVEPVYEKVVFFDGKVQTITGIDGSDIDATTLREKVFDSLTRHESDVYIDRTIIETSLTNEDRERLIQKAEKLVGKSILIVFEEKDYTISDKDVVEVLNDGVVKNSSFLDVLIENISALFNKPPKDSVFVFDGGKVSEFVPSEDGIEIEESILKNDLFTTIDTLLNTDAENVSIELEFKTTAPKISTGDINNLGIKEEIGSGESYFKGSIASRIHNIKLASSMFNGVLIAPGETLSFNKTVGDISKVTGYQQAYIIRDGQTILGDGGGVCQVSTTLFRAALNAGLPIVERRGHSYRVSYYEQKSSVGLDATVFDPTTDLKIKNDTSNYILIQTTINDKEYRLEFNLFGTKDGKKVTVGKPLIRESTPPPEDLYIDDPTLPLGVTKQIDYKAWGAKVYFNYKVEKGEEVLFEKTFYTNYQPWQAKYLRGTGV